MLNEHTTSTRGSWVEHIDETKRGLAKLLARENITVRHDDAASTASFNLTTRELVLPKWTNITVDQYDLLIGHEVAHAKYSDEVDALTAPDMTTGLHTYINVLEDTRIERLIQSEFPGLRGSFRRGYADFFQNGPIFNDIKTAADAAKFSLIDRINIHYKIGAHVAVPFSDDERQILPRIDALRSMREAIALARELYAAEKEKRQHVQAASGSNGPQDADSTESTGSTDSTESNKSTDSTESNKSDDSTDSTESTGSTESNKSDDSTDSNKSDDQDRECESTKETSNDADPVAQTDVKNADAVRELAQASKTSHLDPPQVVLDVLSDALVQAQTMPSTEYVRVTMDYFRTNGLAKHAASEYLATFHTKYNRTIGHLTQEFERRKAAKQYDRAKQSRTGRLDVNKLHAYQFRDDLFKSVTILPNGQNHGIVLLIDGSGSMQNVITDVLQQTLLFASFAKRVNIPVQAYVFGTLRDASVDDRLHPQMHTLYPDSDSRLVTLLDSTAPRWNDQLLAVAAFAARYDRDTTRGMSSTMTFDGLPCTSLGQTPLYSALLLVERHLAHLKQRARLDKTTLFVLTDGANNCDIQQRVNDWRDITSFRFRQNTPMIIRDRVTSTTYAIAERMETSYSGVYYRASETGLAHALVDSIRRRHQTRVVALRIAERRGAPTNYGWGSTYCDLLAPGVTELSEPHATILAAWKQTDQYVLPTSDTYFDAAIVVASSALDLDDEADFTGINTTGKTTRQVLTSFKKAAVAATSNRVLINAIVPYIA